MCTHKYLLQYVNILNDALDEVFINWNLTDPTELINIIEFVLEALKKCI